jgi:very-short-patch-repair endonuclease
MTINSYDLGKKLKFSTTKDFSRKCRIYCNNLNIDIEEYREPYTYSPVVYNLPIKLAIGIVENVRMSNPNRAKVLDELYSISGQNIVTQLPQRKEISFVEQLSEALDVWGITYLKQHRVGSCQLDLYIPEHNIAVEFDEFHHDNYKSKDLSRERDVINSIGCTFVRITETMSTGEGVATVLKEIAHFS